MSKRFKVIILSVAAGLLVIFLAMLLLAVPIGAKAAVLPILAFYVTGGIVGLLYLAAGIFSLICRFRGLTGKGAKYYDNKNTSIYKGN